MSKAPNSKSEEAQVLSARLHLAVVAALVLIAAAQPVVRAFAMQPHSPPAAAYAAPEDDTSTRPTTGSSSAGAAVPWFHPTKQQSLPDSSAMVAAPARGEPGTPKSEPDYNVQIDILTNFYETVIGYLILLLTIVAGFAFWTVKVVTKSQAEETAIAEATRILGDHDGFRDRLASLVQKAAKEAVDRQMEEVRAKLERLEESYVPPDLAVKNPEDRNA